MRRLVKDLKQKMGVSARKRDTRGRKRRHAKREKDRGERQGERQGETRGIGQRREDGREGNTMNL